MKNIFLLILTALIWGFAFVAQKAGMEHLGPFTFNGIRFVLGALSLLPLLPFVKKLFGYPSNKYKLKNTVKGGFLLGAVLFIAASLQQIGIVKTTAGNAGFITGLYQESVAEMEMKGLSFADIQKDQLFLEIVIGLVFLVVAVGGIFVFFRWGFRRLYGKYCQKLKQTLKELNEIDE